MTAYIERKVVTGEPHELIEAMRNTAWAPKDYKGYKRQVQGRAWSLYRERIPTESDEEFLEALHKLGEITIIERGVN